MSEGNRWTDQGEYIDRTITTGYYRINQRRSDALADYDAIGQARDRAESSLSDADIHDYYIALQIQRDPSDMRTDYEILVALGHITSLGA